MSNASKNIFDNNNEVSTGSGNMEVPGTLGY